MGRAEEQLAWSANDHGDYITLERRRSRCWAIGIRGVNGGPGRRRERDGSSDNGRSWLEEAVFSKT